MKKPAKSAYPVLAVLAIMVLGPMIALLTVPGASLVEPKSLVFWKSAYLRQVLIFSLWQAFLSTVLSVGLAVIVSRAFARHSRFPYRNLILKVFGLPLVVPAVVAVFGIVSVFGSGGWIPLGRNLYGLNGILLAHIFFNLPLAVRLLLPAWNSITEQHWKLGQQLGMNSWQQWKYLEWPALRENLPGVGVLIFMLCLTSFAVVLTLGGGPKTTTLEVAIYQSLRFDFEPAQAVVLALLQFSLCAIVALISFRLQKLPEVEISTTALRCPPDLKTLKLNSMILLLAVIYVALPMLATLMDAFKGPILQVLMKPELWRSAAFSITIGLSAATLSVLAAWLILRSSSDLHYIKQKRKAAYLEMAGSIVYVIPPLVIGTGLFVLIAPRFNVFDWAIPIVILVNAIMGLPFAIRSLGPTMRQSKVRYQRLCESLDIQGWYRFKTVDWPLLRKPLGLAMALVTALAMGDLGVIALFGTPQTTTLPLLLYQQLGAYLMSEAAVTAAFLLGFCLLVFWILEGLIGGRENA